MKKTQKWPLSLTNPSFPSKLVIIMIGLPARGKSYVAKKLKRYLKWIGFHCEIFNAGAYRRKDINLTTTTQLSDYFDPNNEACRQQKRKLAMMALRDLLAWLKDSDDRYVGIFDATNSTSNRRELIVKECLAQNVRVLFLENICTDPGILDANYAMKLKNEDYCHMDPELAREDFIKRVKAYETIYEPLSQQDEDKMYIKLINVGKQIVTNGCHGYMLSQISSFLPNLHIVPKRIYLTRHGESLDNQCGKIGGNAPLSTHGEQYAKALHQYILAQNHKHLTIWTSTLDRALATARPFQHHPHYLTYQTRTLNEIYAGGCEGMTYESIQREYPLEFAERAENKLEFRYAHGGESYVDVMERVKPLLLELERHPQNVLIISHRAVLRTLMAYFSETPRDQMVETNIPLHQLFQCDITPHGIQIISHSLLD